MHDGRPFDQPGKAFHARQRFSRKLGFKQLVDVANVFQIFHVKMIVEWTGLASPAEAVEGLDHHSGLAADALATKADGCRKAANAALPLSAPVLRLLLTWFSCRQT